MGLLFEDVKVHVRFVRAAGVAVVGCVNGLRMLNKKERTRYMNRQHAFTLVELLVVIAIIAILMAIMAPILGRARGQGKRAVCLSNLKQLALSWNLYADDYDDRIVNGNTDREAPTVNHDNACWVYRVEDGATEAQRIQGVRDGLLYRYGPGVRLYKCPAGIRGECVTYSIPDAMNGYYAIPGAHEQIKTRLSQIRNMSRQIVFLDEGRLSSTSWTIWYDQERWWDQIPARHGDGTTFSFADGHSERWTWRDQRTLSVAQADYKEWQESGRNDSGSTQPGNEDLHRVQRGVFGRLGYIAEECPGGVCPIR